MWRLDRAVIITPMADTADGVVRRFYTALSDGDLPGMEACFATNAVWHLPGTSLIAGDHHGWIEIRDHLLARLGPLSGGTIRAELLDVAVGATYVVAVQHATASHKGRTLDVTGCQLMTIRDGQIQEIRGHYSDESALNAFWIE